MGNTNYFSGVAKILANPQQKFINNNSLLMTQVKVEISQVKTNRIIRLRIWGEWGQKFKNYYKINDYILVEGYASIKNNNKVLITCLKIYPLFLNVNNMIKKV